MARYPRFAPAGLPLHVTQRGNYRQDVFLTDGDRNFYLSLLDRHSAERAVKILGYVLMTNHIHLIVEPPTDDGLSIMMQGLQSEYARAFNQRHDQRGHVWQDRFHSCVMDEHHVGIALAYVELNPVRARMVESATEYEWSSARAHTGLTRPLALLDRQSFNARFTTTDWRSILKQKETPEEDRAELAAIRRATRLNEPFASAEFAKGLEETHNVRLLRRSPGRPPKLKEQAAA